ncbi:MAG: PD-(D/E)XK nuclease family protein [Lachnospiraceae bacterium]|nr:PD-(D/E)XK nuclease family protein [Lachnospiraceae bacterium]
MSIYLVNGPSGCGKSYYLYESLIKKACENERTSYIFVVPEQFALTTEKELVERSEGQGIMNIEVLSFTRLAYRIMEEAGDNGYPVLNDMGKSMLIRRVMQEKRAELRLYAGKEKSAGFLDEIKSMISELSQYLITPEMINGYVETAKNQSVLSVKLSDISSIYAGFRKKLEGVYTTAETMFELCYKHIGSSEFLRNAVLVFDNFTGFTPCQFAFIEQLMSKVKDVYLCTTMDEQFITKSGAGSDTVLNVSRDAGIFTMSADMASGLIRLGEKNGFKADVLEFEHYNYLSSEISFIRDNIFRYPVKRYEGKSSTVITAHGGRKQEAYYIAARISDLLRKEKLRYDEVAVITGDLSGYAPYFEKAFRDYDISCYIDETKDISSNPLILFISSILEAADSDFRQGEIAGLIKSPLAGYDRKSVCRFENYLICYGYRGRARYGQTWTAEKKLRKNVNLEEINALRADILDKLSGLPKNNGNSTVHEIIVSVYNVLMSYDVKAGLDKLAESFAESGEYKAEIYVKEYNKIFDTVINLFQQMDDLMGNETCTYKEFLDIFMTGVRKTKLGVLPPNKDVVVVGDVWRTRIKGIKVLFFAGVNEGVIPRAVDSGGVLTDEEREILGQAGYKLAPGIKEKPLSEEYYIYLALSKPKERLYVSYVLNLDDGSEVKPSYIVNTLSAITGVKPVTHNKSTEISDIIGYDKGLSYVIEGLSEERDTEDDPLYKALVKLYAEGSCPEAQIIKSITDDYYTRGSITALSPRTADKLYNHILISSVSRMETFSKCAFRHFLKYGLGLEGRPDNDPDQLDYGNLFHDAMKRFGMFVKKSGDDWNLLTPEICEAEAVNCFEQAVECYSEGIYKDTAGRNNLTERMKKVMISTVKAVVSQIQAGDYKPYLYEYAFNVPGRFMNLSGKIDRIDIYRENDTTWLKVIDYKTGGSRIDFVKLYYGLQMQLMVYMNSMINDERFKDAIPAAAFYQEVTDPVVEDKADVEAAKLKELRPGGVMLGENSGIIHFDRGFEGDEYALKSGYSSLAVRAKTLKDGTLRGNSLDNRMVSSNDIKAFSEYAGDMVSSLSREIMQGKITINPYKYENECACEYCEYTGVCGFDKKQKSYKYNYIKLEQEEAISRMVKDKCQE